MNINERILNEITPEEYDCGTVDDVGKIVLYHPQGMTLAVEDSVQECIRVAENCTGETIDIEAISADDNWSGGLCVARVVATTQ